MRYKLASIIQSPAYGNTLREISALDDSIAVLVQAINHSNSKRAFWKSMADDPAEFVKKWVSSQKRDLDTLCGEAPGKMVEEEEVKRASLWKDKIAESVYLMLNKRQG
jgi:SWI/SNF-related matrix-associated actin-dependent regulator of chromatin subfamily D